MDYLDRINALKAQLESIGSLARLDLPFVPGRAPTQAFSEFLTNKEQGDWAEQTFIRSFNEHNPRLWACKYGRSEDLVAGEPGFDRFYADYQAELGQIGKRPDVLLFERERLSRHNLLRTDISTLPLQELDEIVPYAKAAIEVRSSAFLSRQYEEASTTEVCALREQIAAGCAQLRNEFAEELHIYGADWLTYAENWLRGDDAGKPPKAFARRSTVTLQRISELTRHIKGCVKQLSQRRFLSITPKAEDLSLVYRWLQRYGVPHHYCQVFFDRAVLISFERILELISDPERENIDFFVEADTKNQGKVTFKIDTGLGMELINDIDLPAHHSAMKRLPKGRLLFYVQFEPSSAKWIGCERAFCD